MPEFFNVLRPEDALMVLIDRFSPESACIYELVTGWPMSPDELKLAGERINNLKKMFNIREGWTRADDTLPPRILQEKLPTGVVAGVGLTTQELDMMIQSYYMARGWTEEGLIPEAKLQELGLLGIASGQADLRAGR